MTVPTPGPPDVETLAAAWQSALCGTSLAALGPNARRALLTRLATDLLADLAAECPDPAAAAGVGSRLLYAHLTDVDVLARTLAVLGDRLAPSMHPERLAGTLGGVAAGVAAALRDRTRSEQELITAAAFRARRAAEDRYEAVFAGAAIGIAVGAVDGPIIEANPALCAMLGYAAGDLVGREFWEFDHPDDPPGTWQRIGEVAAGLVQHLRLEKPLHRKDGETVLCNIELSLVTAPEGQASYIVALVDDITERRALQDRLLHQARHDPLTGLPNRTLFFDHLDRALAAGDAGVCYLDLDGFKAVNDTLGHSAGDDLLRTVAHRLDTALRPEGHLVARMGGDEFVVLVSGSPDRLAAAARTALRTVRRPMEIGGQPVRVSASAGLVSHEHGLGDRTAPELMKAADATLYWAKADGRDRCAVFDPERYRADVERFELAARMPEALRRGEFLVEYQPLVRLADRRMIGVEALARWTLGGRAGVDAEPVDPARFVALAEQSGLIVPLGRHVLREACRAAARWPGDGLLVSVNVAARQLTEPGFVDDALDILTETGWPAEQLQLELTESALTGGTAGSIAALRSLRAHGVRIAIDDFGTGYSNFAYLQDLPVDTLKLAAPLVRTVGDGPAVSTRVVGLIVELALVLGLSVVAEAVETAAQARRLAALGCEAAQGWYFAPSLPADEAAARAADPWF